ncbi:MAG TPA: ATP-binding cassette domain-containing protein [Acidimicrobiales bacterium]|nr:ATP-binding cassette domain-containing protein [Acidimicrobiales bacterium]
MANAIEATDLVKTFKGGVRALEGVSLTVEEGTVFGLLGPNGAGKTTAVRILTTILQPDSGSGRVLGHDVVHEAPAVRTCIGLAGQYAAVDENLTGRENIRLVGQLSHLTRKVASARADELLERFELTDAANRPVKTYSGGMRRRLDLAAALVDRPPVLFLDEPTTGLDPYSRVALWSVIGELTGAGATVLLTTQYLEEADRLADRLAVVDHGKVIAEGTSGELKASLGATVLDLNMGDSERAARALHLLAARWPREPVLAGTTVELQLDGGARMVTEALGLLDEADLIPTTLAMREPSLDDVFLALTGHGAESDGTEAMN